MKQAVALHSATELSAPLAAMQETFGLTLVDIEAVQAIVSERSTNLSTIEKLLDFGLNVQEVEQVYDARDRINDSLGQSELAQTISLTQLVRFQQQFRSEVLDADSLVERVVAIHERFRDDYLGTVLSQLCRLGISDPDHLPESLADFMAGDSDLDIESEEE